MINIRPRHVMTAASIAALASCLVASVANAEVVVRGIEGRPLDEVRPAPTFFKPDLAVVTSQPSPSEVNPSFLGPVLLMKQAQVDLEKGTAKLAVGRDGLVRDHGYDRRKSRQSSWPGLFAEALLRLDRQGVPRSSDWKTRVSLTTCSFNRSSARSGWRR